MIPGLDKTVSMGSYDPLLAPTTPMPPSVESGPRPGIIVDGYRLVRLLGKGGMGEVWQAHHDALDRTAAVKFLLPHLVTDAQGQARFLREIRVAAALVHPRIIGTWHAGLWSDHLFLVQEFMAGGDLAARLQKNPDGLPVEQMRAWWSDAIEGLAALHAAGMIHRDIKPQNLLLDAANRVAIADLGLARAIAHGGSLTAEGHSPGTPAFMAPEQVSGGIIDARADVYALGVVGYLMLTGRPPHRATTLRELWAQIQVAEIPALRSVRPDVPEDLSAIIHRCLERAAEKRPADAGALMACLHLKTPPPPGRANKRILVASIGIGMVTWVGIGLGWSRHPGPTPVALTPRPATGVIATTLPAPARLPALASTESPPTATLAPVRITAPAAPPLLPTATPPAAQAAPTPVDPEALAAGWAIDALRRNRPMAPIFFERLVVEAMAANALNGKKTSGLPLGAWLDVGSEQVDLVPEDGPLGRGSRHSAAIAAAALCRHALATGADLPWGRLSAWAERSRIATTDDLTNELRMALGESSFATITLQGARTGAAMHAAGLLAIGMEKCLSSTATRHLAGLAWSVPGGIALWCWVVDGDHQITSETLLSLPLAGDPDPYQCLPPLIALARAAQPTCLGRASAPTVFRARLHRAGIATAYAIEGASGRTHVVGGPVPANRGDLALPLPGTVDLATPYVLALVVSEVQPALAGDATWQDLVAATAPATAPSITVTTTVISSW